MRWRGRTRDLPETYLSGRVYLRKPLAAEGRAALLQILPGSDRWPLE